MNRVLLPIIAVIFCCTACRSWHMNEYCSVYSGIQRSFDINKKKYKNDKNRWYKLELYNDGKFWLGEISGHHIYKSGRGRWYHYNDYLILVFNDFEANRKQEKLEESLLGTTFIHSACMVLKKKGRKDLKLLPGNAVLRLGN